MSKNIATEYANSMQRFRRPSTTYTFSEAFALIGFGKFNYLLILISGMVTGTVVLETASIGFILPIVQCEWALTNQYKRLLIVLGFLGIMTCSHIWISYADAKGRRQLLWRTMLATFFTTFLTSFSHKFVIMMLLRCSNGVFLSSASVIYSYLGEFHSNKLRSRVIMCSALILYIITVSMPIIACLVLNHEWSLPLKFLNIDYKPWRLFLIVCGLPSLICSLTLYVLPESPQFLLAAGKEKEAIEVLLKMYRWNGGKETLTIKHILPDDKQTVPIFQPSYLHTPVVTGIIQFCLLIVTYSLCVWFVLNSS